MKKETVHMIWSSEGYFLADHSGMPTCLPAILLREGKGAITRRAERKSGKIKGLGGVWIVVLDGAQVRL